jgi:hypothetical protein
VDGLRYGRLRPESASTFPEQTARHQREGCGPVQDLLRRMKDVILKRLQLLEPRGSSRRSARNEACAHKLRECTGSWSSHRLAPQCIWIARIGSPSSKPLCMTAEVNREVGAAAAPIIM